MSKLRAWKTMFLLCVFCALAAIGSSAQTLKTLVNFDGTNGNGPNAPLVQGTDGDFYGTTYLGGASSGCAGYGCGTVFKMTPGGTLSTLYSFCAQANCTDGAEPAAGLVLGTDGLFYGTTFAGGLYGSGGYGTIFTTSPSGGISTVYNFGSGNYDGTLPVTGLVQGNSGTFPTFYGTTASGGVHADGTIYKIVTGRGTLFTTLYNFCPGGYPCTDGLGASGLIQATNGNLYGTTSAGGANSSSQCRTSPGCGTVFTIPTLGLSTLTTLYNFCAQTNCTDGSWPNGVIQASDGNFYGTTTYGGTSTNCQWGCGTVFKITPSGTLTTLYSFCSQGGCTDGSAPSGGLVQASDGNLYGTTAFGGANCPPSGCGTVFKISRTGTLTTLYSFCALTNCADGTYAGALVEATNGTLYGTTSGGGADNDGTVFSLSVGLGPFLDTLPTAGNVGTAVTILGSNLTGSTSVTFNGTSASFTVKSSTEITTTVPSGATTGKVKVTTPSRTLTSNVNFRVTPTVLSFSPTSGPVGTSVVITGQSFTGTTSVTFGGVKATSFTVNSYTQITATVPSGAKTGKIGVTTPGGTAISAGTFTVT